MLSILIPTYNYDVTQLVATVHKQLVELGIIFEIIVFDDASINKDTTAINQTINKLKNSKFIILPDNIGRSKIRNLLAQKAIYKWLLFLDADVKISNPNFIKIYLESIDAKTQVIYGGIEYQKEKPAKNQILRWIYGNKRESLSVKQREENPYISFLTLNFLIKKDVFDSVHFNEDIPNLRHEDTLFALNLKEYNISITHINNPIIHLGLESSSIFLKKSEEAIDAILLFEKQKLINPSEVKITRVANKYKSFSTLFLVLFNFSKPLLKNNILSNNPSLLLFDFYRLGYLFTIKSKTNA